MNRSINRKIGAFGTKFILLSGLLFVNQRCYAVANIGPMVVPETTQYVSIDGYCDLNNEYQSALGFEYDDADHGVAAVRFQHDDKYLFVCFDGVKGIHPDRFVSVYLDTGNGREPIATQDDYSLRAALIGGVLTRKHCWFLEVGSFFHIDGSKSCQKS
jgi:hypothetical protein